MESMSSGGLLDLEEWLQSGEDDDGEGGLAIQPFSPDQHCLARIARTCPDLQKISLLVKDRDLQGIGEGLAELRGTCSIFTHIRMCMRNEHL